VQRQRTEITVLRDRLSEALGSSYAAGLPEADRLGLLASRDTRERIAKLEQDGFELRERIARQSEDLEAVGDLNRELMATLNARAADIDWPAGPRRPTRIRQRG
jgi:hypothetical protein